MIIGSLGWLLWTGCASHTEVPVVEERVVDEPVVATSGEKTPWPEDHVVGPHGWWAVGEGLVEASERTSVLDPTWGLPAGTALRAVLPEGFVSVTAGATESGSFGTTTLEGLTPLAGPVSGELVWLVSPTFSLTRSVAVPAEVLPTLEEGTRAVAAWEQGALRWVGLVSEQPDALTLSLLLSAGESWERIELTRLLR